MFTNILISSQGKVTFSNRMLENVARSIGKGIGFEFKKTTHIKFPLPESALWPL